MVMVSFSILFISLWSNRTSWCLNFRWLYIFSSTIFPTSAYSLISYHQCALWLICFCHHQTNPWLLGFPCCRPSFSVLDKWLQGSKSNQKTWHFYMGGHCWSDLYLCLGNIKHVLYFVFNKAFLLSLLTFSIH